MAGMLPGVECARRRHLHKNTTSSLGFDSFNTSRHGSSRRSSFCLYTSNHGSNLTSTSTPCLKGDVLRHGSRDENLGQSVREAKERLDERLRAAQWKKSQTKRSSSHTERQMGGVDNGGDSEGLNLKLKRRSTGGAKRFMTCPKLSF